MFGLFFAAREQRATLENPRYSIDDLAKNPDLFFGGSLSDSGIKVDHNGAFSLDPFWQATTKISGDIARLPLDIFYRGENDSREVDKLHPAWYLVSRQANDQTASFIFWRRILFHACVWGNGYAWIDRNGRGEPIGLYNLLPDRVRPEIEAGQLRYIVSTEMPNGTHWERPLEPADVLHIQGPGHELWEGSETLKTAKNSLGLALSNQKYTSRFFNNGVRAGGILKIPPGMQPEAAKNLHEQFTKANTTENGWFKTIILRDGADFIKTSINPNEAQNNETAETSARNIARRFNMAPSLLGVAGSSSYGSVEADNQSYLDGTLAPWMRAVTSECWVKLLSKTQKRADSHYFEHNTGALLTANILTRYQVYAIGLRNKVFAPNEVRAMENMNPAPGGDQFLEAYGTGKGSPGDNQTNQYTGDNPGGMNTKPQEPPPAGKRSGQVQFICKLAERAKHKAKSLNGYLEWLDSGKEHFEEEARNVGVSDVFEKMWGEFFQIPERVKTAEELRGMVITTADRLTTEAFENE